MMFFFCKQKTTYEMRISDWSSDVCSSELGIETKCAAFAAVLAMAPVATSRPVEPAISEEATGSSGMLATIFRASRREAVRGMVTVAVSVSLVMAGGSGKNWGSEEDKYESQPQMHK